MSNVPETKVSLILRLREREDVTAWEEFLAIYQPVIYRVARRQGLQDADANETVQEVLLAVARAVADWEPEGSARFLTWLMRIVRNKLIDHLRRRRFRAEAVGGSSQALRLQQEPDPRSGLSAEIDREYRRELFRWAAAQVRQQVQPNTWAAFWKTNVQGKSAEKVAVELNVSVGAVYIARSRVLARLREIVQTHETY